MKVLCSDCFQEADYGVTFPHTDLATPYCDSCLQRMQETEMAINDHELKHFEGFYGLASHDFKPLESFKWSTQSDGRLMGELS